jgi:hypothetical protein
MLESHRDSRHTTKEGESVSGTKLERTENRALNHFLSTLSLKNFII